MISEPFVKGNSYIHRLDPRVKIIMAAVFSFVIALSNQWTTLIAALTVAWLLVFLARLSLKEVLKRILLVNGFILLLWVMLPLTFKGDPWFYLGSVPVIRSGVLLALRITLKSNAIVLLFMALVATSSTATLGHALNHLFVPKKMIYLLLLTYRYVFVIEQEYQRLVRAMKVRCFKPKTNMHTYRTYAYLVGMLLVRASIRAERVHQAMCCRGFKGKFYSLHEFSITRLDWIVLCVMITILIGLGVMEWQKIM